MSPIPLTGSIRPQTFNPMDALDRTKFVVEFIELLASSLLVKRAFADRQSSEYGWMEGH
jgi:hypothetical protein